MSSHKVVVTKKATRIVSQSVQGPAGEQGIQGIQGEAGTSVATLGEITDVTITAVGDDDVLQFNESTQEWTNRPQENLVDGGNF